MSRPCLLQSCVSSDEILPTALTGDGSGEVQAWAGVGGAGSQALATQFKGMGLWGAAPRSGFLFTASADLEQDPL